MILNNFNLARSMSTEILLFSRGLWMCRKSNISSLAQVYGGDRNAIEAGTNERRTFGESVQREDSATLSGQAQDEKAISGRTREDRVTVRSRKSNKLSTFEFPRRCINTFPETRLKNAP